MHSLPRVGFYLLSNCNGTFAVSQELVFGSKLNSVVWLSAATTPPITPSLSLLRWWWLRKRRRTTCSSWLHTPACDAPSGPASQSSGNLSGWSSSTGYMNDPWSSGYTAFSHRHNHALLDANVGPMH